MHKNSLEFSGPFLHFYTLCKNMKVTVHLRVLHPGIFTRTFEPITTATPKGRFICPTPRF
jgi:hypothetical protein